jgi:hypothetical protein
MENKFEAIIRDLTEIVHLKDTHKDKMKKMKELFIKFSNKGIKGIK